MDKDVHLYNRIFLSHKNERHLSKCNIDVPRGYYAKRNKSERERRIPCDFTYTWNLKNKINKQTQQTHRYREQIDGCQMGEGLRGWMKKLKGLTSTDWQLQRVTGM